MDFQKIKQLLPVIIAISIAVIVTAIYILSGKGNQDLNTRILEANQKVEKVETTTGNNGDKTTNVKCTNGSSYGVYYPPDSTDFSANAKVKCEE